MLLVGSVLGWVGYLNLLAAGVSQERGLGSEWVCPVQFS